MKRIFLLLLLLLLTGLGFVPRLWQHRELAAAKATQQQVRVIHPVANRTAPLSLPATLQAIQQTSVSTRTSGTVQKRLVDIGDHVKQGQLLAVISAPEVDEAFYQSAAELDRARAGTLSAQASVLQQGALVRQAKANLSQTQGRVQQARADAESSQRALKASRHALESAQANLARTRSALALADKTWKRWDGLAQEGAVTQQDADNQQAAFQQAQATVDAAQAGVGSAQEDVLLKQNGVLSAQASVSQAMSSTGVASESISAVMAAQAAAQANLQAAQASEAGSAHNRERQAAQRAFEEVRAPFDGIITSRAIDVGALVKADNVPTDNKPAGIFGLARTHIMRALVPVPQTYAGLIHDGDAVEVHVREFPQPFVGKVFRVAGGLEDNTRTVQVEIHIQNLKYQLKPGMYAETAFSLAAPGLVIPATALQFGAQGTQVGLVVDGKVHFVTVGVGRDLGKSLSIESGLKPEDDVIANPSQALSEGTPVETL